VSILYSLGRFLVDAVIVVAAGWLLVRALQPRAIGLLEESLGWLLSAIVLVAASGVVLGEAGGLGARGFLAAHGVVLLLLLLGRRTRRRGDWLRLQEVGAGWRSLLQQPGAVRWAAAVLLLVTLLLGVLAAAGEPLVFDALTYRLPRIGQWLQDGRITCLVTDDARLNYLASGQDLVVAWLVGAWPSGFQFAPLAQTMGGALLLGATAGLARRTGLSRLASLGAAALVLGLANVAPQMTSAHTDLFAAGVFAAAFYLWLVALGRNEGTWLGGVGLAFALAAKGTLFYLLPSVGLWVVGLAWRRRPPVRAWVRTALAALLGAALFLGPPFARNLRLYGHLTAPAEAMQEHYGPALTPAQRLAKLSLNLHTSFLQLLEPASQPWGLRSASGQVARNLAAALPQHDPYAFDGLDRRANLLFFLSVGRPNADFATPGLPMALLFLIGAVASAWRWREPETRLVAVWAAGVVVYVFVQNALLQWHPWAFRYTLLVAPWVVIVAVWLIERAPRGLRVTVWAAALASGGIILTEATFFSDQLGWQAWQVPLHNGALAQGWRQWARNLAADTPVLRIAQPGDRPLAWFFRIDDGVSVRLESRSALPATNAEEALAGAPGWLVVPAKMFAGQEGRVLARTWLHQGDAADDLSLAAYRALRPGEVSSPVFYRKITRPLQGGVTWDLQVRSWQDSVRLELANPWESPWEYVVHAGGGEIRGVLPAHGDVFVDAPVPSDRVAGLTVDFRPGAGSGADQRLPAVVAVRAVGNGP